MSHSRPDNPKITIKSAVDDPRAMTIASMVVIDNGRGLNQETLDHRLKLMCNGAAESNATYTD